MLSIMYNAKDYAAMYEIHVEKISLGIQRAERAKRADWETLLHYYPPTMRGGAFHAR